MAESISEWQESVHALAVEKGWHDEPSCEAKAYRSSRARIVEGKEAEWEPEGIDVDAVARQIALIHSEASEALEALRDGKVALYFAKDERDILKPEGVASELADLIIRSLDLGGALGLNIEAAMKAKHAYNKTRPRKHGGKAI